MPYKNTAYPKVMANMNRKITDKVKFAINYLEQKGYQEILPTKELSLEHVHEQFYVVCDDSFNGIALVTFNLKSRQYNVLYINNDSKIVKIKNDNNDTQIGVNTQTGLFILSDMKQRVNIISPMWDKPYKKSFFSNEPRPKLTYITDRVPGIGPVSTSDRLGGRTRRARRAPARRSNTLSKLYHIK